MMNKNKQALVFYHIRNLINKNALS